MNQYQSIKALENALEHIKQSPSSEGSVALIVARPEKGQRKEMSTAELQVDDGMIDDNWKSRGYKKGPANPDMQLNIMNARVIEAIAQNKQSWALAGDQFYVDFDLSKENLPPGTRCSIGTAIIEITAEPHLGCQKFSDRFGRDAVVFVNSDVGKALNLRGINAKIVSSGAVRQGDIIRKI